MSAEREPRAVLGEERRTARRPSAPPEIPDYELLERIGGGSYGEVWLGRSVTGACHAIKIIERNRFDDEHPYDREFKGLQNFEPVSRGHEHLVDILHVGRQEEFFFYVMELADDASGILAGEPAPAPAPDTERSSHGGTASPLDPSTYLPHTLRVEISRTGGLDFEPCMEIALQLTRALDHLHDNGLVHRDVKPSNVIFVGGVPKLADIGLVADFDATMTRVGTTGFLAPEGPGDPQADLFSLGKVLYEMSTGHDRLDFPELPTTLIEDPERDLWAEFNEVVIKACDENPRQRYASTAEMLADLQLIRAGRSLKKKRLLERRLAVLTKVAAAVAVIAVVLGIAFLIQSHQTGVVRRLAQSEAAERERAESALQLLEVKLAQEMFAKGDSSRGLAHLARLLREDPGNRFVAEQILAAFADLQVGLPRQAIDTGSAIKRAYLSPDDRHLLTVAYGGAARLFELETGEQLEWPFDLHKRCELGAMAPDGSRVALAFANGTVSIVPLPGHPAEAASLEVQERVGLMEFSPSAERLLTLDAKHRLRVWDLGTGSMVSEMEGQDGRNIQRARFSPDGENILTSMSGHFARVWNASTGEPTTPPLQHGPLDILQTYGGVGIMGATFSPDGSRFATNSIDSTAQIWDSASGAKIGKPLMHKYSVWGTEFSPDGTRLATASFDRTARLWDARTGQPFGAPMQHGGGLYRVTFSPDGLRLATNSEDHAVRLWDALRGQALSTLMVGSPRQPEPAFTSRGDLVMTRESDQPARHVFLSDALPGPALPVRLFHEHMATHARFGPRGEMIVSLTDNRATTGRVIIGPFSRTSRTARVWDTRTGKAITPPLEHGLGLTCAEFDAARPRLATGSKDGTAHLWDLATGEALFPPLKHEAGVCFVRFLANDTQLLTLSWDGGASIWDAETGQKLRQVMNYAWDKKIPPIHPMRVADVSRDGRWFATGLRDPEKSGLYTQVGIWNLTEATPAEPVLLPKAGQCRSLRFSPDGNYLVAANGFEAGIWETSTGQRATNPLHHEDLINDTEFSPDGRLVVTASRDRTARLWDARSGELLHAPLKHADEVVTARFSPDGLRLVTASWDRTARVWDVATGMPLMKPFRHDDFVHHAEFRPDGRQVATACLDGTVQLWDVPVVVSPAPPWLAELAEMVAGLSLSADAPSESETPVPAKAAERLMRLRQELLESEAKDACTRWARWFLADRSTRPIAPGSSITIPEYARQQAESRSTWEPARKTPIFQERRLKRLIHAMHLSPNDPVIQARLALMLIELDPADHPRALQQAVFFSKRALEAAPENQFVREARTEVNRALR